MFEMFKKQKNQYPLSANLKDAVLPPPPSARSCVGRGTHICLAHREAVGLGQSTATAAAAPAGASHAGTSAGRLPGSPI